MDSKGWGIGMRSEQEMLDLILVARQDERIRQYDEWLPGQSQSSSGYLPDYDIAYLVDDMSSFLGPFVCVSVSG